MRATARSWRAAAARSVAANSISSCARRWPCAKSCLRRWQTYAASHLARTSGVGDHSSFLAVALRFVTSALGCSFERSVAPTSSRLHGLLVTSAQRLASTSCGCVHSTALLRSGLPVPTQCNTTSWSPGLHCASAMRKGGCCGCTGILDSHRALARSRCWLVVRGLTASVRSGAAGAQRLQSSCAPHATRALRVLRSKEIQARTRKKQQLGSRRRALALYQHTVSPYSAADAVVWRGRGASLRAAALSQVLTRRHGPRLALCVLAELRMRALGGDVDALVGDRVQQQHAKRGAGTCAQRRRGCDALRCQRMQCSA